MKKRILLGTIIAFLYIVDINITFNDVVIEYRGVKVSKRGR